MYFMYKTVFTMQTNEQCNSFVELLNSIFRDLPKLRRQTGDFAGWLQCQLTFLQGYCSESPYHHHWLAEGPQWSCFSLQIGWDGCLSIFILILDKYIFDSIMTCSSPSRLSVQMAFISLTQWVPSLQEKKKISFPLRSAGAEHIVERSLHFYDTSFPYCWSLTKGSFFLPVTE